MPQRGNRYDVVTDGGGGTLPGKRVGLHHGEEDFEFGISFTVKVGQMKLFVEWCVCGGVCVCCDESLELLFADKIVISSLDLQNFKKFDY